MTETSGYMAPALGRAVTLDDLLPYHPGHAERCLCGGTGILVQWVGNVRAELLCGRMRAEFLLSAKHRISETGQGARWLAGMAPEDEAAKNHVPDLVASP